MYEEKKIIKKKKIKKIKYRKKFNKKKIVKRNGSLFQALQITNLILSHQQNEQHS